MSDLIPLACWGDIKASCPPVGLAFSVQLECGHEGFMIYDPGFSFRELKRCPICNAITLIDDWRLLRRR